MVVNVEICNSPNNFIKGQKVGKHTEKEDFSRELQRCFEYLNKWHYYKTIKSKIKLQQLNYLDYNTLTSK